MSLKSQGGFVTLLFLSLFPLLMTLIIVWMTTETAIIKYAHAQDICRLHALKLQEITLSGSNDLIALNPLARQLRNEHEAAQRAVDVAKVPPAQAAARAWLLSVKIRQALLAARQKQIFITSNASALAEQTAVAATLQQAGAKINQTSQFKLHLKKTPASNITPDYDPDDGFEIRQSYTLSWELNLAKVVPSLLLKVIEQTANNGDRDGMKWIQGKCTSTYTEDSQGPLKKYYARLGTRDKSSWSLF